MAFARFGRKQSAQQARRFSRTFVPAFSGASVAASRVGTGIRTGITVGKVALQRPGDVRRVVGAKTKRKVIEGLHKASELSRNIQNTAKKHGRVPVFFRFVQLARNDRQRRQRAQQQRHASRFSQRLPSHRRRSAFTIRR